MAKFSSENQPTKRRGPSLFKKALRAQGEKIIGKLAEKALAGDVQSAQVVLPYMLPKLRSVTPENSLDAKLLEARIREIEELEIRISKLEKCNFERQL